MLPNPNAASFLFEFFSCSLWRLHTWAIALALVLVWLWLWRTLVCTRLTFVWWIDVVVHCKDSFAPKGFFALFGQLPLCSDTTVQKMLVESFVLWATNSPTEFECDDGDCVDIALNFSVTFCLPFFAPLCTARVCLCVCVCLKFYRPLCKDSPTTWGLRANKNWGGGVHCVKGCQSGRKNLCKINIINKEHLYPSLALKINEQSELCLQTWETEEPKEPKI